MSTQINKKITLLLVLTYFDVYILVQIFDRRTVMIEKLFSPIKLKTKIDVLKQKKKYTRVIIEIEQNIVNTICSVIINYY